MKTIQANKLKFSTEPNTKLTKINKWHDGFFKPVVLSFWLPSGYTCPSANECQTWFSPKLRKIKDGNNQTFRCFSASLEARLGVGKMVWHNFNLINPIRHDYKKLAKLILDSLRDYPKPDYVRIHIGGDFYTADYFKAWCYVADWLSNDGITFYAYTKELATVKSFHMLIPSNLKLTLSKGGKHDNLINEMDIKVAEVVTSENDTELPIDYNEFHAINTDDDFALVLHGTQPKLAKVTHG